MTVSWGMDGIGINVGRQDGLCGQWILMDDSGQCRQCQPDTLSEIKHRYTARVLVQSSSEGGFYLGVHMRFGNIKY